MTDKQERSLSSQMEIDPYVTAADLGVNAEPESVSDMLDLALSVMNGCVHDGGFDREIGPIGCYLGDKCVCIGVYPLIAKARAVTDKQEQDTAGVRDDWFSQVVGFLVKHEMLDVRDEYDISDVLSALADNYEPKSLVRRLEWYPDPGAFPFKTWGAQSSFGRFLVEEVSASDSPAYEARYTPHHLIAVKDSLDDAKASAQADYERRILSALITE